MEYAISVVPDTAGFMATCRDLPEFIAADETVEGTLQNAVEMLETTIGIYIDERRLVPAPSSHVEGERVVRVPTSTELKALISNEMIMQGVIKAEMVRRLAVHPPQVDRLLDVNHKTKLDALDAAMAVLGKRLSIVAEPA